MVDNYTLKKIQLLVKEERFKINDHAHVDMWKHNYTKDLISKALNNGEFFEDEELYGGEAEIKHSGKNFYCLCCYKEGMLFARYLLISFVLNSFITIIHISPCGGKEVREYKRRLKNPPFKE